MGRFEVAVSASNTEPALSLCANYVPGGACLSEHHSLCSFCHTAEWQFYCYFAFLLSLGLWVLGGDVMKLPIDSI